jgi:GNAT superfamily N-acetyltransferase
VPAEDAQARFTTATTQHLTAPLAGGVTIRHVGDAEWHAAIDTMWTGTLDRPGLELTPLFSSEQSAGFRDLDAIVAGRLQHRMLFETGGEIIGGYWGQQETFARYYMTVSVFRPEWRGRGLYRELLERVTAAVAASGFREIHSRHRADNNAILVPKLRAGWVIAAFEVAPRWGLTVHLRKYLVDGLTLAHEYRIDGARVAELRERGLDIK